MGPPAVSGMKTHVSDAVWNERAKAPAGLTKSHSRREIADTEGMN